MRSMVALAAGALVAAVLYQVGAIVALLITVGLPLGSPGGEPPISYYVLNLGLAALAAALGGAVSAWAARGSRHLVVAVLAVLLAGVALAGFSQPASQWPQWYPLTLAVVGAGGTLLGGRLWSARAAYPRMQPTGRGGPSLPVGAGLLAAKQWKPRFVWARA